MAKKKRIKPGATPAAESIDLVAVLEQIRPHLKGMTQHEIAEAAGISQPSVAQALNGARSPSLTVLEALAQASGGSLELTYRRVRRR